MKLCYFILKIPYNFLYLRALLIPDLCFPVFAWQAYERGADVHLEADPTKLALLNKEFKIKKEQHEKGEKESIIEKVK